MERQEGKGAEQPIRTAVADVWVEADGTMVLRFRDGVRVMGEHGAEAVRAHLAAARGRKLRTLADVRGVIGNDRQTRQLAAGPEVAAVTLCMAVLVGDPLSRTLGNFFLLVSRPAYPTRIFTDEAAARRWLAEEPTT